MSCTCACTCARTRTHRQTQSGVSCRPLLLSSLNQIPGTGLNNLNENAPPPPFEVLFPLVHSSHEGLWHQVVTGSQSYKRATQRENVFLHNCSSGGKKKKKKSTTSNKIQNFKTKEAKNRVCCRIHPEGHISSPDSKISDFYYTESVATEAKWS